MTPLERFFSQRFGPDWRRHLLRWAGVIALIVVIAAIAVDPIARTEMVSARTEVETNHQEDTGNMRIWTVRTEGGALRRIKPRPSWKFDAGAEICIQVGRTAVLGNVRSNAVSLGPCRAHSKEGAIGGKLNAIEGDVA